MQRTSILLFVVVVFFATATQAQAPAPKPNPELKKLLPLVGHWTYEGEYKPGPLGPGGKITGVYDAHWILGGFFLQAQEAEKGEAGETHNLEIDSYDPVNKTFASDLYQSDGTRFSGTLTIAGNTITWAGKWVIAGKQYLFREPFVLAPDSMSGTTKGEISTDGKTWTPFFEGKFTKAKPGSKK
jgi:hypothetical protein